MADKKNILNIFGLNITKLNYDDFMEIIESSIENNIKTRIAYANAYVLNNVYKNNDYIETLNKFDIIHPDGIGIFLASRFLYGRDGLRTRITGSDFYPLLIKKSIERGWSLFFFGHDEATLNKINLKNPELIIRGKCQGYSYDDDEVIQKINLSKPDILIVGLGFGKQENWIVKNKEKIDCNVILAVGEGIKVFSGTKKRGYKPFKSIGLEWMVRLFYNPRKYWRRYLIGNPLFLVRIIKIKLRKFS